MEPLQRLQRDLEDLVQAAVAEGARHLPVRRQRARVGARVHLGHELLEDLEAEDDVRGGGLEEARDLLQHLLRIVQLRPPQLRDARQQLHERRVHKRLARRAVGREEVERVVAALGALLRGEVVPAAWEQALQRVRRDELGVRQLRVGQHELTARNVLGRRRELHERRLGLGALLGRRRIVQGLAVLLKRAQLGLGHAARPVYTPGSAQQ